MEAAIGNVIQPEPNNNLQENVKLCLEAFPLELWSIILKYLYETDQTELWTCRLICKDLRSLADQILRENLTLWSNSFDEDSESWWEFLKRVKGTRFSTGKEVQQFIDQMRAGFSTGANPNPFPNGLVILSPKIYPDSIHLPLEPLEMDSLPPDFPLLDLPVATPPPANPPPETSPPATPPDFFPALRALTAMFRTRILALVYSFNKGEDELAQLLCICKLKNLRSLAIHKTKWKDLSSSEMQILLQLKDTWKYGGALPAPDKLKELQVFGEGSYSPALSVFPIFPKIMKSLKKLQISNSGLTPAKIETCRTIMQKSPMAGQLFFEHLKLILSSNILFLPFKSKTASFMKLFSVKFTHSLLLSNLRYPGALISTIFEQLDTRGVSQSLEVFHIDVDEEFLATLPGGPRDRLEIMPPVDSTVPYLKVTHLIVNFSTISLWQEFITDVVKLKFTNLKKLTILTTMYKMKFPTPKEFYAYLSSELWKYFGEGVNTIHVPYFGWVIKKGNFQTMPNFQV